MTARRDRASGQQGPVAPRDADPESAARQIALRQLTMGPRTRAQLSQALAKRAIPLEAAEAVLERFTEVGLIDDASYAQAYVRSAEASGGLSRRRVATKLRQRGVADDVVAETVDGIDTEDERSAALAFARRRAPRLAGLEFAVQQRRLAGMLSRRGYPPGMVWQVVSAVLATDHPPDGAAGSN